MYNARWSIVGSEVDHGRNGDGLDARIVPWRVKLSGRGPDGHEDVYMDLWVDHIWAESHDAAQSQARGYLNDVSLDAQWLHEQGAADFAALKELRLQAAAAAALKAAEERAAAAEAALREREEATARRHAAAQRRAAPEESAPVTHPAPPGDPTEPPRPWWRFW